MNGFRGQPKTARALTLQRRLRQDGGRRVIPETGAKPGLWAALYPAAHAAGVAPTCGADCVITLKETGFACLPGARVAVGG